LYETVVAISHKTQCISTGKADLLTLSYGVMAIYFKNHTKYINALYWHNIEIPNDKRDTCCDYKGGRHNT